MFPTTSTVNTKISRPSTRMLFYRETQVSEMPRPQTADPGERIYIGDTDTLRMSLSSEKLRKEVKNRVTRSIVTRYHYAALAR